MFSFNKQEQIPIYLVHRSMASIKQAPDRLDIVISPELYVFKKEDLPVKTRYAAKRIAPSVMTGYLEESATMRYFVYPCDTRWCIVAYDPKEIETLLQKKGLPLHKVRYVYFAQQFDECLEKISLRLENNKTLTVLDGIVTLLPYGDEGDANGDETKLLECRPSTGIRLYAENRTLSLKKGMLISGVLLTFGFAWFVEGYKYSRETTEITARLNELYAKEPMLQSSAVRENILKKYIAKDENERKKRRFIQFISRLVSADIILDRFSVKDDAFEVRFLCKKSTSCMPQIRQRFTQTHYKPNIIEDKPYVLLQGSL